jgi:hypothetical protein
MGKEEMLTQQLRVAEYDAIITELRTPILTTHEELTARENTTITNKGISGIACNFRGAKAIAKLKARIEERLAAKTSLASRKEITKDKNAMKTAMLVTINTGVEVLSIIETQGDRVINKLSVTHLHVLLVRADPHKNATKPSKKDGPSMVLELDEIVKATRRCHDVANPDAAPLPAIEAPQLLPLDINRGSFGSVASSFFSANEQGGVGILVAPNVVSNTAAVPVPD